MAISGSDSGGGGGMMDSFTTLGTKIHEDSLESMNYFQKLTADRLERERQAKLDAENKRQFNVGAGQTNRAQNMGGIAMLGQARQSAEGLSRQRGFRSDLSAALRRA